MDDFLDKLAERLDRDPQSVYRDVSEGRISQEHLEQAYKRGHQNIIAKAAKKKQLKKREPLLKLVPKPYWTPETAVTDEQGGIHVEDPAKGKIFYQHTVLCQTSLPYKDPGDDVYEWERENGFIHLRVEARKALDPSTKQWVRLGLPWGAKPRLIMAYLNTHAIEQKSPDIEVDNTLRKFITTMGYKAQGYDYRTMKEHLAKLSASDLSVGVPTGPDSSHMFYGRVVKNFDLWVQRDQNQRMLWPSVVSLSQDYFETLVEHAVPLPLSALSALKDNPVRLDVYCWLAQRLHRIHPNDPDFIAWTALYDQFGQGYKRLRAFRENFLKHLKAVHDVYPESKLEADSGGLTLYHSPPPISKTTYQLIKHRPFKRVR
ncbi:MAG: replication protein RepA [Pseudomonadota bacterium]